MRKIIYTINGGNIAIVTPIRNIYGEEDGFTDAEAEQRAFNKLPQNAINPRFVEDLEIPTDRKFRDAWEDLGVITINMTKARGIIKEDIRKHRLPVMNKLDIAYYRADEQGDLSLKLDIAAKKQILRDATEDPQIVAAQTPEELLSILNQHVFLWNSWTI